MAIVIRNTKYNIFTHKCNNVQLNSVSGGAFLSIDDEDGSYCFYKNLYYCPYCGLDMKLKSIKNAINGLTPRKLSASEFEYDIPQ